MTGVMSLVHKNYRIWRPTDAIQYLGPLVYQDMGRPQQAPTGIIDMKEFRRGKEKQGRKSEMVTQ